MKKKRKKRQRSPSLNSIQNPNSHSSLNLSPKMGIFEPFRAIGYITTGVPFSVQRLGTETFVTVSVGKAFQVYNCAKLTLVIVSPQLPHKIRALACYRDFTFVAYATHIAVFKRAHQVN
jgi:U3 small nucleolar RNA-associated protein 21